MANLAFLEALMQNFSCGINLVRFDNSADPSIEELNVVVLENWPEAGCIILSPWEGEQGRYYEWRGNCEKTQPLLTCKINRARCRFSITAEDLHQEKIYFKELLTECNYKNWLSAPILKSNLVAIRNDFFNCVNKATFFKKKYCNYRDLIMWGSTCQANYIAVEKVKNDLKEDQIVKSIFNMPRI